MGEWASGKEPFPHTLAQQNSPIVRFFRRASLVALSLILAVLAGELLIRSTDSYGVSYYRDTTRYINEAIQLLPMDSIGPESRIFQNRPDVHLELESFDYATDSLGMRCDAPHQKVGPRPAPKNSKRILFLGDSVTLGWGVNDSETWIRLIEGGAIAPDGRELDCLNAGHLQYNTAQEADLFDAIGDALLPEAVVVTFVTNDVVDNPFDAFTRLMKAIELAQSETGFRATFAQYFARTKGWFWGVQGLLNYREQLSKEAAPGTIPPSIEGLPGYAEGWERSRAGFDRILQKTRELSIPLLVLDHGKPRIAAVQAWCEANVVPWYAFDFSDTEWEQGLRNSPADAHANPRGNEILYQKARAALVMEGWLDEAPIADEAETQEDWEATNAYLGESDE